MEMWKHTPGVIGMDAVASMLTTDYEVIQTNEQIKVDGLKYWVEYINECAAYDTETSSWRLNPETGFIWTQSCLEHLPKEAKETVHANTVPRACTYAWMVGIRGICCMVRSWEDFTRLLLTIAANYNTDVRRRFVIYVHNLPYEFQFMAYRFDWFDVFSVGDRGVIRAVTKFGVEFRDSLILAKLPLANVADELAENWGIHIPKLVGNLDYAKIRHPGTPLTAEEIEYNANDVKILTAYVWTKMQTDGDITKIPMTDTGYVRQETRDRCLRLKPEDAPEIYDRREGRMRKDYVNRKYKNQIRALTLTVEDYKQAKRGFAGGDTHANPRYVDRTLENVYSYDETSAYPTMQIAKKYPMGKLTLMEDIKTLDDVRKWREAGYYVQYDLWLWDVESIFEPHQTLSESKCKIDEKTRNKSKKVRKENPKASPKERGLVVNNGRIYYCEYLETTTSSIDDILFSRFYKYSKAEVHHARVCKMDYLPKELIESILYYYKGKCTLKGVKDKVLEYLKLKGELNSEYGMMVMDIVRQICEFGGVKGPGWHFVNVQNQNADMVEKTIEKYNKSKNRFTWYIHGCAVTAWARHSLRLAILAVGEDFVYCDTDSVKFLHLEKHKYFFDRYNDMIKAECDACLKHYGIDPEESRPKGKQLGVWDYEGCYRRFKTLGAKRYLVEHWDDEEKSWKLQATVAGCNKQKLTTYLETMADPFEFFAISAKIPHKHCGRMLSWYVDPVEHGGKLCGYGGSIKDYLGNVGPWSEISFVCLEPSDYELSRGVEFDTFLTWFGCPADDVGDMLANG